jgi:hypothetical protein
MEELVSLMSAGTSDAVTGYELRFEFLHTVSPPFSRGTPANLEVLPSGGLTDATVSDLDSLVTTFYMLASTGALGGDVVPPWESNIGHPDRPERGDTSVRWHFDSTHISQPAVAILAQLLDIASTKIERATFASQRGQDLIPLRSSPQTRDWYPRAWADFPFEFSISDEINKAATLAIIFRRQLSIADRQPIEIELLTWATATRIGAYGIAPVPPERCGLVSDQHVAFFDEALELSFRNITCHPAAFRGLANVCAAIARKLVPIRLVSLE